MAKTKAVKAVPAGYHSVTPNLCIDGTQAAIDWYRRAFGAETVTVMPGPDGKIVHAEIAIGDSRVMLHDPVMGHKDPKALGGSPASLFVYVTDADGLFNQAVREGATVHMPMADQFWGDRTGSIVDPYGYSWMIATHVEDVSPEEMRRRGEEFFKKMGGAS
jgi:PhnB protein